MGFSIMRLFYIVVVVILLVLLLDMHAREVRLFTIQQGGGHSDIVCNLDEDRHWVCRREGQRITLTEELK